MARVSRKIGLSLGADLCWPICFEDIISKLDLSLPIDGDDVRFDIKRVTIQPYDLQKPNPYDIVVDRLTHWYGTSREWIKKSILLDGVYVLNNPWSVQSMEKQTSYCAMMKLGLPIPKTWMVPPKEYDSSPDLERTLASYAELFDLEKIGAEIGYPLFMKPYDGGGWVGVSKIDNAEELQKAYDESGKFLMHLQKGIVPYEQFIRCVGLGPQTVAIPYDPGAPLHERYTVDHDALSAEQTSELRDITLTINAFFGWDFNSCESLLKNGVWNPIDFANPCPDSQVTSLHFYFPWLVKAYIRWTLYVAATKKRMRQNLDWEPFFEVAEQDLPYRERLAGFAKIAHDRFETARFEEFCDTHLANLDEVAWEYFASDQARAAVRGKVEALFPEHEWDEFTEHFWSRIQDWRAWDASSRKVAR